MLEESDVDGAVENETVEETFEQARFSIRLNLPPANAFLLEDAGEAVKREYRDSVKWKRLRCRNVEVLAESGSHTTSEHSAGTVFILEVGHAIEFDWTWEGAVAFKPLLLKEFAEDSEGLFDDGSDVPDIEDSVLWSGEILEVDEAAGRIYVCVADPEHPPVTGTFYVRPFEFLAFLHAIFQHPTFDRIREMLPARLAATEGNVHPDVDGSFDFGLPDLQRWWSKSWSILWGPPGTGKTHTTGQQVAHVLADPGERILVISTTNRATDAAAIATGRAAVHVAADILAGGSILRIGKGASLPKFESEGLTAMLKGTETEFLARIEQLSIELARSVSSADKALIRREIKELREQMRDAAQRNFLDSSVRVVVATAFRAMTFLKRAEVKESIESGSAPFTTVFIDEAGLISRAAIAALSLLASRRVVLVGDSKQLAPISRISRILPTNQMKWLANSGLSHLDSISTEEVGVHVLQEQRRMHADVCSVVSEYQYDGFLKTAPEVNNRSYDLPELLQNQPRAIWYVLDEAGEDLPSIRAERGPGNRSWMRVATEKILVRMFSDPTFRAANGLFIAPFTAQAKEIGSWLATNRLHSWSASTVHSQQGSEADIVIFDTVNAGSYSWPYDEWKRLVNVALSRSREAVIILTSRAEMNEPYLRPLIRHLSPAVLRKRGTKLSWEKVPVQAHYVPPNPILVSESDSLGYQISMRKELRPVLSQEQERLCGLELDGKPRLVRGVAGSGKTVVLAHWLMQTVKRLGDQPNIRIWAVFANRSLQSLISDSIVSAWDIETGGKSFPWDRVSLKHVREILEVLLPEARLSMHPFGFEYDDAAAAFLSRRPAAAIKPRCDALFIDEAQDMGPNTLKLLAAIVRQTDTDDANSKSVNIFYDNAQNIYGRKTPTWSELGLDMRGRSSVMKESFRSTKPITEFALNVLYRLQPPDNNPDHKELVSRGLIEQTQKNGSDWWTVRFNQIDGPKPSWRQFKDLESEFDAIGDYCCKLIQEDGVQPSDICLLYNGSNIRWRLETQVAPKLAALNVELLVQTNIPFSRSSHVLLATTSHSFKGYDSEIVIIPAADQYTANQVGILANNLYVAMTRARSILTVFTQKMGNQHARHLYDVLEDCLGNLCDRPEVEGEISIQDDLTDILEIIGHDQRKWLTDLWNRFEIEQEPLSSNDGELIAEPLFWFRDGDQILACFGGPKAPRQRILQRLEDLGIQMMEPGQAVHVEDTSE